MACAYIDDNASKHKFDSLDIAQEPQEVYLPIKEDDLTSIVSLEQAVNPLIEFLPKILEKVELAKQHCTNPSDGLSCDESASIYLCSMRWKPHNECLYFILNTTLRDHNKEKLKPWNLYLRLLYMALNRLPSTQITFYQEIRHDFIKNYSKESFFVFWDFTFCSLSVALSQKSKQALLQTQKRTIFAFECGNAKLIERHSYDCSKNELLLIPTQFQFVGYLDRRNDLDIIRLREHNPLIQLTSVSNQPGSISSNKEVKQTTSSITTSPNIIWRNSQLQRLICLHQSRSQMNLTYQNLTADDMPIVVEQAVVDKQCTKLLLDNNYITFECISILVLALPISITLRELSLHEASIYDMSVQILAETLALNNSSINTLGLNGNYITDEGAQYLVTMLKTNTTLTQLYLQGNPITRKGVKLFVNALNHHNNTLKRLDIDSNNSIIFSSIRALAKMLRRINH